MSEFDIEKRLRFMAIDDGTRASLKAVKPLLDSIMPKKPLPWTYQASPVTVVAPT